MPLVYLLTAITIDNNYELDRYIQGVSQLVNITVGGDFLGICDQKSLHNRVSDF